MGNQPIRRIVGNLDVMIAGIALVILIICTFMGVVMRYFFNNPFVWLQEVQLWCFTWVVFFGCGLMMVNHTMMMWTNLFKRERTSEGVAANGN